MTKTATIIKVCDNDNISLNIISILLTRGVNFIYKASTRDLTDTIVVLNNQQFVRATIEESKNFQNFTESQLDFIMTYFNENSEEVKLNLTANYLPTKPTSLF